MHQKEDVGCALCESADQSVFNESNSETVHTRNVICNRCGLIFVSPRLSEPEYLAYYADGDYVKDHYGLARAEDIDEVISWRGRRAKEKIDCFPEIFCLAKNALEIGAGVGVFLDELKNRYGTIVAGIEPSKKFAEIARARFNIPIFEGTLQSFMKNEKAADRFDLVIMDQVIEHLYHPLETLRAAASLLVPNGYLYVGAPNIASPKHPRDEFFIGPHVYTFNPWTITLMLWRAGLKVVRMQTPSASPLYLIATPISNPAPMVPLTDIPGPFRANDLAHAIDSFVAPHKP